MAQQKGMKRAAKMVIRNRKKAQVARTADVRRVERQEEVATKELAGSKK